MTGQGSKRNRERTARMEICREEWTEAPLTVRLQVNTGSEVNAVGARWMAMLEGGKTTDIRPIEVGWVSDATFEVSEQICLRVKVVGTNIARVVVFMLLPYM